MSGKYHVVNFSGGKDSTAMLHMMIEREMPIDEVVYFDTGWDFPQMERHIWDVEQNTGIKITRLYPDEPYQYLLLDKKVRGRDEGNDGYGFARMSSRWCTSRKTSVINRHIAEQANGKEVIHYIGIAADEPKRIKNLTYPLYEWGVTEKAALDYCYKKGYTWGGLYEIFDRVSCWCCPLQGVKNMRNLRKHFPDLWDKLVIMDKRSCNGFKFPRNLEYYEQKFSLEDTQMKLFD